MNSVETVSTNEPPPQWEIEWRVFLVLAEQCELQTTEFTLDSRLIEDLGMDSLAIVELFMGLEEEFEITIPDEVSVRVFTESNDTVRHLIEVVQFCWGSGNPDRVKRREARQKSSDVPQAQIPEMPFTQLGGRLDPNEWLTGALHEPISSNREGYPQFRRTTDGMRCVVLPAAQIRIGNNATDAIADQGPEHIVRIDSFLMDAEPVSCAAYSRFLNSIGNVPDSVFSEWCGVDKRDKRGAHFPLRRDIPDWKMIRKNDLRRWKPIPKTERQPMILVSWFGANAYSLWAHRCDWRYYRGDGSIPTELQAIGVVAEPPSTEWMLSHLPSEAQWEYAATGEDILSAGSSATAVVGRHAIGATYTADTLPAAKVSQCLGMSPFGLHHMAGNVWQWCRDWYMPDFYQSPEAILPNAQNTVPSGIRSERGGSWVGPSELAEPWYRRGRTPEARGRCLGFRCASAPTFGD